jgi:lactate dehydrogenase-like 2-hydroxyacid dehydrogenase
VSSIHHPAILAEGRLAGKAFDELDGVAVLWGALSDHVLAVRPGVRGAIVLGGRVDEALLERLPDLAVVSRFGVGYDAVDIDACSRRGVQVAITPGPVEAATAELAMALILASRRSIPQTDAAVRRGEWSQPFSAMPTDEGIHAAKLGLIGFGRIGQRVARSAAALGADIYYATRNRAASEIESPLDAKWLPLPELLRTCDIISLHLPLNEQTRCLIGRAELALMRDGATLVNTARGPIVDEPALVAEIACGRISAALDVFSDEPHVPRELLASPRVVLSPHVGSGTRDAREQMTRLCVDNLLAVLNGRVAPYLVPEQMGVFEVTQDGSAAHSRLTAG